MANKGALSKDTDYAKGGGQLGRTHDWLKTPDRFAGMQFKPGGARNDEDWEKTGKTGKLSKPTGDKGLKAVLPQKAK
jgi:hypothetical protein